MWVCVCLFVCLFLCVSMNRMCICIVYYMLLNFYNTYTYTQWRMVKKYRRKWGSREKWLKKTHVHHPFVSEWQCERHLIYSRVLLWLINFILLCCNTFVLKLQRRRTVQWNWFFLQVKNITTLADIDKILLLCADFIQFYLTFFIDIFFPFSNDDSIEILQLTHQSKRKPSEY